MAGYLENYTILLVGEDTAGIARIAPDIEAGCAALYRTAAIAEGIELCRIHNPDIILASLHLSDTGREETFVFFEELGAERPVIVMGSAEEHDDLTRSLLHGARHYLLHPFGAGELLRVLGDIASALYYQRQYQDTHKLYEQYKQAVDITNIVTKTDPKGIITYANEQFVGISGYSRDELIGHSHRIVRHPETPPELFRELWSTITAKKVWKGVVKNRKKNGEAYIVSATIMPILDEEENIVEYIAIRQDITELLNQQHLITQQTTDALTNLPNREKLLMRLKHAQHPNLALIDIEGFRDINELYGFEMGDRVLVKVTGAIADMIRPKGYELYKLPADEMVIFTDSANDVSEFEGAIADILCHFHNTIIQIGEFDISISLSAGISYYKSNGLNHADVALQNARKQKKHYKVYQEDYQKKEQIQESLHWHNMIKKAIREDRIIPHFQPIYNTRTQRIDKYESLVRFIDEEGETISPSYFLEVAKKYLQYELITRIMIEKTFEYFRDKPCEFSVNLSIEDIFNEHTVAFICEQIEGFTEPHRIIFEITESQQIDDYNEVCLFLDKIKERGCKIAIDDFGSGYSNFEHIIHLKADYLKIDGSLIKNINTESESRIVVETILLFANKLGINTIAEFVGTKEVFDLITAMGADYMQGYFIGEPGKDVLSAQLFEKPVHIDHPDTTEDIS